MKLIQCDIPADLCQGSFDEAVEKIESEGFKPKSYILFVSVENKDDVDLINKDGPAYGWCIRTIVLEQFPTAAWMILDLKERFIFYSEGV
jgi:hypothetical protein